MKKRLLSLLLIALLLISLASVITIPASAATYSGSCGDNVNWNLNTSTGELTISGTGAMWSYNYYDSTPWYSYRSKIKTVNIKTGVTIIGSYAFSSCDFLTSVNIGDSVTIIGSAAFAECKSLTNVIIGNSVKTIEEQAFYCCTSLTSITIPDSVTRIDWYAFNYCHSIKSVTIGKSLENMTDDTLISSYSLTSITVDSANKKFTSENGVLFNKSQTTLFRYPSGKTDSSYIIPDSVTTIGSDAFSYCTSLTSITIPDSVTSIGERSFLGCTSLTSVAIPDSVTRIGSEAFSWCESITSVSIGTSLTSIGHFAFEECTSLTTVYYTGTQEQWNKISIGSNNIPLTNATKVYNYVPTTYSGSCGTNVSWNLNTSTGVLTISGTGAMKNYTYSSSAPWYSNKSYIKTVNIADGVISIGSEAFYSCDKLTSITIGGSVTSIGNSAFYNCASLTSITIPDSVTSIGEGAFGFCKSLTSITIGDSVTSIGNSAFASCTSLTSIEIPDSVTSIGRDAFRDCNSLTSITIGDSVTSIGSWAFYSCYSLSSITIPDSVTSIGGVAFYGCTSLRTVYYTGTQEQWKKISIGSDNSPLTNANKVYNHSNVTSISIDSLPTKTEYKLYEALDTTGLTLTATLNDGTIKTITDGFEVSGFDSTTSGTKTVTVTYEGKTATFDVVVIENFTWTYDAGYGSLTITGEGEIPNYAQGQAPWYDLQYKIYSINIGEGITSIGNGAFAYMYYARSLSLPESLEHIGTNAFYNCFALEEVLIPDSVTTMGGSVFAYCLSLKSVSIPASLSKIYNYTFYDCNKLTNIYYAGSADKWNTITADVGNAPLSKASVLANTKAGVDWNYENGVLTISGYGRMKNYTSKNTPWYEHINNIKKIVVEEGVTGIGNWAFAYCYYATEISLPDSLVHIGSNAFYNCMSLETLDIPEGVTRIYGAAFYNCKKLDNITIPAGIDTIYKNTFASCDSLTNVSYNGTEVQYAKIDILDNNFELLAVPINYLVDSILWDFDLSTGTLTISGSVAMDDYELNTEPMAPWASFKTKIKKVIIENGVPNIGKNAFYGCSILSEVVIPDSVTSIGYGAFMSCYALKKVTIPSTVTYIGSAAFNGCALLTEVNIPAGVTNIYSYTFYNCKKLSKVTLEGDKANINIVATGNEYFTALIG